jgi:hypothetical protein
MPERERCESWSKGEVEEGYCPYAMTEMRGVTGPSLSPDNKKAGNYPAFRRQSD